MKKGQVKCKGPRKAAAADPSEPRADLRQIWYCRTDDELDWEILRGKRGALWLRTFKPREKIERITIGNARAKILSSMGKGFREIFRFRHGLN